MGSNKQQVQATIFEQDLSLGDVADTKLVDASGKDNKTFTVIARGTATGTVTLQISHDRLEWFDHPNVDNPVTFAPGVMTLKICDTIPFFRLRITMTADGIVEAHYTAH